MTHTSVRQLQNDFELTAQPDSLAEKEREFKRRPGVEPVMATLAQALEALEAEQH
ncbi:MAG: hypothetical protein ACRBC3_09245 [Burkholderiaceae bacterium]